MKKRLFAVGIAFALTLSGCAEFNRPVNGNPLKAPGDTTTIVVNIGNVTAAGATWPTSYSNTPVTWSQTVGGVTIGLAVANFTTGTGGNAGTMQNRTNSAGCSYLKSTSLTSGYAIKSVQGTSSTARNWDFYGSTSTITVSNANPAVVSGGTKVGNTNTNNSVHAFGSGTDYDSTNYPYTHFAMVRTGSNAGYYTAFTITIVELEPSSGPVALANPNPQYDDSNKTVSWTVDANATKYQAKVDDGSYNDIITETYDASGLTTGEQHTVYIKAVGDGENYSSTEGSVQFTPTAPFVSKEYTLCTSLSDLEAGASYVITNGTNGSIKAMATTDKADNRPSVDVTASNSKFDTTSTTLTLTLGGSSNAWTFQTENYLGTAGYFAPSTGDNNKLRIVEEADTCTISFDNNAAVITFSSNPNNRNIIRYNGGIFSCYASGQDPVYLWKEHKELISLNITGTPTKLTGYYDSEDFDPTGITAYQAVYSDSSIKNLSASDIVWPDLTAGMTTIKGSYTEFGTTVYTPTYNITVAADSLSTISLSGTMTSHYYMDESWDKGSLVVTATYSSGQQNVVTNDAALSYYSNSSMTAEVATPAALGAGANQTIYVKATYDTVSNATGYAQTVTVEIEHGSVSGDPLTVEEAVTIGNTLTHNTQTSKQYYISGVVSQIDDNKLNEANNYASFYLQNGEITQGFQVYQIAPDNSCTNYNDFRVGAEVLIKCQIKKYSSTIETGTAKSLLSITYTAPELTGVTLNKSSLLLSINEEFDLVASPAPIGAELGAVSWSSSNDNVATVADGTITAVAAGSAVITAEAGGFSVTCNVTVSLKDTMEYTAGTTTNMGATGNAATVNLDSNLFTVNAAKGGNQNFPGLNKDNDIRAYSGNDIIVTIDSNYTITSVVFDCASGESNCRVYANNILIEGNNGTYSVNYDSFRIHANGGTIKINSVDIFYRSATIEEKTGYSLTQTKLSYRYEDNGNGGFNYSDISIRFGGLISKTLWNELDTNEHLISGFGVMITEDRNIDEDENIEQYKAMAVLAENSTDTYNNIVDYYMSKAEMATPVESGDNYIWNLFQTIDYADINKTFVAVAYIKMGDEYVFMEQVRYSVQTLAADYLANRGCNNLTAGGSLSNLAE